MLSIQKTLELLQPYVIGIRYLDGLPLVDAVLKDGWTLGESDGIKKVRGNEELNYYMIFSEKNGIGLDELLNFVDITIKENIEREKKHELLKEKVNELKELFKKTSLIKLKRLTFDFTEEDLISDVDDFVLDEKVEEVKEIEPIENPVLKADESEYSDDESEIIQEEIRADNFRKIQEFRKNNTQLNNIKNKVELPPKKNYEPDVDVITKECNCGPNDACGKCIENKEL